MHLPISPWSEAVSSSLSNASLIVDALLGTGLDGPLRPPYPEIIGALNASSVPVLAVDIPSGLDSDTGRIATDAVVADRTVTFALPKLGLFRGEGPRCTGLLTLADIELPRAVYPPGKVPPSQ